MSCFCFADESDGKALEQLNEILQIAEKMKSPVQPSEKLKPPLQTSDKIKPTVQPSEKIKAPVQIAEKIKSPAQPSEKIKSPVLPADKKKVASDAQVNENVKKEEGDSKEETTGRGLILIIHGESSLPWQTAGVVHCSYPILIFHHSILFYS